MSQADDFIDVLEAPAISSHSAEEAEILQASIKAGTIAQIVVAVIATIGLIYLLKLVLLTILCAILLAYLFEPPVNWLARLHVPRWLGAAIVVTLALVAGAGTVYFSYNRAVEFGDELPRYSARFRDTLGSIRASADSLNKHVQSIVEPPNGKEKAVPVKLQESHGITQMIFENTGTISDLLLSIGFIPFLVYFMLTLKQHTHVATVRLFPKEHRLLAHRTIGRISAMIRTYLVANVLVGVISAIIFTLIFWRLGIQYPYFVAAISGFASLIPYVGVFLALLAPLADIGTLDKTGIAIVVVAVIGLHLITMNVLYPKFIGRRLRLNPLAVSMSLLFWAWIWGAAGLLLAIPLLGVAKIICDHVEPLRGLGAWLGESLIAQSA